jgi:hypothetical protein
VVAEDSPDGGDNDEADEVPVGREKRRSENQDDATGKGNARRLD